LPQLPCQYSHLPLLVGQRVLRVLSLSLESIDLLPLLLDLFTIRGTLLIHVPLDELLLVIPDLQVEGLDLCVEVNDFVLMTADALLVALPQVRNLSKAHQLGQCRLRFPHQIAI
jgi:hypothetical protein